MAERIYTRRDSGELKPLTEKRFSTEDALQELLAEHPELLGRGTDAAGRSPTLDSHQA